MITNPEQLKKLTYQEKIKTLPEDVNLKIMGNASIIYANQCVNNCDSITAVAMALDIYEAMFGEIK